MVINCGSTIRVIILGTAFYMFCYLTWYIFHYTLPIANEKTNTPQVFIQHTFVPVETLLCINRGLHQGKYLQNSNKGKYRNFELLC